MNHTFRNSVLVQVLLLFIVRNTFCLAPPSSKELFRLDVDNRLAMLPSEEDLRVIARKEKAFILTYVQQDDPHLQYLKKVTLFDRTGSGVFKHSYLSDLAKRVGSSITKLRKDLGMPAWAKTLVLVEEVDMTSSHMTLMEEVFHVLEGDFETSFFWSKVRNSGYIAEVVNDFLQLMFYPVSHVEHFKSEYIMWSLNERIKLLKIYRQDRNPNFHMRAIIQELLKDVKCNKKIIVERRHIPLINLLFKSKPSDYQFSPLDVQIFLEVLLETERFSSYKPLFPNLKPEHAHRSRKQRLRPFVSQHCARETLQSN